MASQLVVSCSISCITGEGDQRRRPPASRYRPGSSLHNVCTGCMKIRMRTTISLDDGLAEDVKRRAAELRTSVSALIESLIREGLHRREPERKARRFRLVTVRRGQLLPGIDLDRAAKLIDEADTAGGIAKMGR
jgi:Arc/MetJ family transcription regulator